MHLQKGKIIIIKRIVVWFRMNKHFNPPVAEVSFGKLEKNRAGQNVGNKTHNKMTDTKLNQIDKSKL